MPEFHFQVHNCMPEGRVLILSTRITSLSCGSKQLPNFSGLLFSHTSGALRICKEFCSLPPCLNSHQNSLLVRTAILSNVVIAVMRGEGFRGANGETLCLNSSTPHSTHSQFVTSATWPHPTLWWPRGAALHRLPEIFVEHH